jgi:hypothetical protein
MNKGRVGEERGGKEMDECPLTEWSSKVNRQRSLTGLSKAKSSDILYYVMTSISKGILYPHWMQVTWLINTVNIHVTVSSENNI